MECVEIVGNRRRFGFFHRVAFCSFPFQDTTVGTDPTVPVQAWDTKQTSVQMVTTALPGQLHLSPVPPEHTTLLPVDVQKLIASTALAGTTAPSGT